MSRATTAMAADLAIGLVSGLVATKVTGFAQEALYRPMPESVKEQEERVRPGPPPKVAAEKTAERLGVRLEGKRLETAASVVHYGLGAVWGPVYGLLRRHSGMSAPGAGFVTGASMSLIVDEALTPVFGFSAPNRDYPPITHLRGLLGHLVYGATVAVTAEVLYRLVDLARSEESKLAPTGA